MDSSSFDRMTRLFASAPTRRGLGGILLGSVAGLVGAALPEEVEAHNPLARCRKIKNKKQKAACLRKARKHNAQHRAQVPPPPPPDPCAGVMCPQDQNGVWACQNGACVLTGCQAPFRNCNDVVTDGCETNTQVTFDHCGRCGIRCPQPTTCQNGRCVGIYSADGGPWVFAVPGNGTLAVEAFGARGGNGGAGHAEFPCGGSSLGGGFGHGGIVSATFAVTGGEQLHVFVGGEGGTGTTANGTTPGVGGPGGVNGGASGGIGVSGGSCSAGGGAGGGGGASEVRRGAAVILLAAGGGGGGGGAGDFTGLGGRGGDGGGGNPYRGLGGAGSTSNTTTGQIGGAGSGFGPTGAIVNPGLWDNRGRVRVSFTPD